MKRGQNRKFSFCNLLKNRSGLSTIVITLIITLLALVAIGIVWVVVRNLLASGSNDVTLEQLTTKLDITNAYEQSGDIYVVVKRAVGEGELIKIKFILTGGDNSEVLTQDSTLGELKSNTFILIPSDLSSSSVSIVSVAPVIRLADGSERLLDITDTYYISATSTGGTGTCIPACSGSTPYCVSGICAECSGSLGCTGTDICDGGSCVSESACTPACIAPQICDNTIPSCVDCLDSSDCIAEGEICTSGVCVSADCDPDTCEETCSAGTPWECGTRIGNCGQECLCGTCAEGEFCYGTSTKTCEVPTLINEGIVSETWPEESGMYFGSPDLPTIDGIVNIGNYVSYTGAVECSVVALFRTPIEGYIYSHIGFNFGSSIGVGDEYQIWQTEQECAATIA